MKDYIIKKFIINDRLSLLDRKKRIYEQRVDSSELVERQINRFNAVWKNCYDTIPFYKQWRLKHDLPNRISCINDLQDFPLLTKRVIQDNQNVIFHDGKSKNYISTGGSTGEPTRFPSSPKDALLTYADNYVGRSWWGIQPLDHMLLFWGHSHLFGADLKGTLNNYKRRLNDYASNIRRLNAYDMTPETVERYFQIYRASNPDFIVGYTSCLYKLAKYAQENSLNCGDKHRLKAVIATAETITHSDIDLLRQVFRVPVVIEYGMAETGVIGYSRERTNNVKIFWDSFIATAAKDNLMNVTTIYGRFFPLINYRTDDVVAVGREIEGSILEVDSITGRKQDILKIGTVDGTLMELSGILMVHILKSYPHVFSIQFKQLDSQNIRIFLIADRQLDLQHVKDYFLREIKKDHSSIQDDCIDIIQVDVISRTPAGKEIMVTA